MTLQRWKSHKIVEANPIQGIHWTDKPDGTTVITMLTVGGKQYDVPENFGARGWPEVGDYFVRYPDSDNYVSWSPKAAFEAGNDLLLEDEVTDKPGDVRLQIEPATMGAKPKM